MEKRSKLNLSKLCNSKLPTLPNTKSFDKLKTMANSQQLTSSGRFNDLRKLYFQYKSNAKILQNSPYYTNRSQHKQMISLISKNRYTLGKKKENEICQAFNLSEQISQKIGNKSYKNVKIKLSYIGSVYEFDFAVRCIQQMNALLKMEIAKLQHCNSKDFSKCFDIIGFQTIPQNYLQDYLLHIEQQSIFKDSYHLKPFFKKHIKGKASLKNFKLIKCLGNGGFSMVYLAKDTFAGKYYALKLIDKKFILQSQRESIIENERYVLGELKSPFITQLDFAFETKNHFAFFIEYCPGGELFYQLKKVKRMSQQQAKFYFLEILIGLDYIHKKKIIYRDLKPENLLIAADGHIKIADFGLAKPLILGQNRKIAYSFCGSPEYMAPEMLLKNGHTFTLDYYCLGALLYELVIGLPPYYSLNHEEIYHSIFNQELSFPHHVELSVQIKNLLKGLLEKNPIKRLGHMYGIKQIIIHPWVGKINIKTIQQKKLIPPFIPDLSVFNFDQSQLREKADQMSLKIEDDMNHPHFQTHFNEEFYYEKEELITRNQVKTNEKTIKIKTLRGHHSADKYNSKLNGRLTKKQYRNMLKRSVSQKKFKINLD